MRYNRKGGISTCIHTWTVKKLIRWINIQISRFVNDDIYFQFMLLVSTIVIYERIIKFCLTQHYYYILYVTNLFVVFYTTHNLQPDLCFFCSNILKTVISMNLGITFVLEANNLIEISINIKQGNSLWNPSKMKPSNHIMD